MNGNLRLGSLFGIPFYINPSWFLVLGLVTLTYGQGLARQFPLLSPGTPLLLGLVTALLLFASVVAHELGHSVLAQRQGIGVQSITLFLFGGLANLEKESRTPAEAFWVAIAGPLVSLGLFAVATLIGVATGISGPLAAILSVLASVNLALALFNLIPGLPLDGGNILKAAIWKLTGNPYRGTIFASRVGQVFGGVAIASGLLPFFLGGSTGSFWNVLVGWFLLQNAGQAAQFASLQNQLSGLTAVDAVLQDSPVVLDTLSLRDFADQQILSTGQWRKYLVTNQAGQLLGTIAVDALSTVAAASWSQTTVQALTKPIAQTVQDDQPLLEVATLLEQQSLTAMPVISRDGLLVGLLEKASILNVLQSKVQVNPA